MIVERPVGIDLGTTNSAVAILDPSERDLHLYTDRFGRKTMPSVVAWDPKKERLLVGRPARNRRGKEPAPVESIKRRMGRTVTTQVGPDALLPEEISAKILAELRTSMQRHLADGVPDNIEVRVDRAVITVPAYFDAPQMEATHKAGELAGFEVLGVLQEPTAAAIYHTWRHGLGDGGYLIYDLGGGTFDVSILRCLAGEYQVLAIEGDSFLGGDDFDRRYAEHLRKHLVTAGYRLDLDIAGDKEDRERFLALVHIAQGVKESLSTQEVVSLSKSDFAEDQDGELMSLEMEIGRADYEVLIADFVATTIACCQRALAESKKVADLGLEDIDHIILVGGSTRVPLVIAEVTEHLCGPSRADGVFQEEVDTCVALGAAIHAAQLGGLRLAAKKDGPGLLLLSPLVSRNDVLSVKFAVENMSPDMLVFTQNGEDICDVDIVDAVGAVGAVGGKHGGPGASIDVPLSLEGENVFTVRALAGETVLAEFPLSLYRGETRQRASALSQPSVVAKDIALDVLRAGRRDRKILIPRGSGLPVTVKSEFFTTDKSGAVVLRLLQNRTPIKTLVIEVTGDVPVGSAVELTLTVDESMRIEAKAVVGGQELWAQIEPAALEVSLDSEAVEALLAEGDALRGALWGQEARYFESEYKPLVAGLRETLGTDPDKAAHLAGKLRLLMDNFRDENGHGLTPPMFRFEGVLNRLRKEVYGAAGGMMGMDHGEWEKRIAEIDSRGQSAWDSGDARAWRRSYNEAQALMETAAEQKFAQNSSGPGRLAERLVSFKLWETRVRDDLFTLVLSSVPEVKSRQEQERAKLASALDMVRDSMDVSPDAGSAIRAVVDTAETELNRIVHAIERLPQMGAVSDRA